MVMYIVYKDFKKVKGNNKNDNNDKLPEQMLADVAKLSPVGVDVSKMEPEGSVNAGEAGGIDKRGGDQVWDTHMMDPRAQHVGDALTEYSILDPTWAYDYLD